MPTPRKPSVQKRQTRPLKQQRMTPLPWLLPTIAVVLALVATGMGWYGLRGRSSAAHATGVAHDCGTVAIGDGSDAQLSAFGAQGTQVALSPASFAPLNACFMGDFDAGTPVSIVFTNTKATLRASYEYSFDGSTVTETYSDSLPGHTLPSMLPCNVTRQQGGILFACGAQLNQFFTEQPQ